MSEPTEYQEENYGESSKSFGSVPTVTACRSPIAGTSSEEVAGNKTVLTSVETEINTDILQHEEQCSQQTTNNSQQNETLDSGLSPISCTDFDVDESVMDFQETDALCSGLSPISSIDFDQYESSMDFQQNEASISFLSDISSTDNLNEYAMDNEQGVTLDSEISTLSSIDLLGQDGSDQKQETSDSGLNTISSICLNDLDESAMNSLQNEMNNSALSTVSSSHIFDQYGYVSGESTISSSDSIELNKSIPHSPILKSAFFEKFLTRDAFQSLRSPRPTCSYITPEEEAIKSRRNNDDLNSTCPIISDPDTETKKCDTQLQDDVSDVSDVSEEEFTETLFQQTKQAFIETGEPKHIRRWSLEKIETELVQFKECADIERAKLVYRGKILDKELKQLKKKNLQPTTENEQMDEEKKDENSKDDGSDIVDVNELQDS